MWQLPFTLFHLQPSSPLRVDRKSAYIAGMEHTDEEEIKTVTRRVPTGSHMTFCFLPVRNQEDFLGNTLRRYAVDQSYLVLEKDSECTMCSLSWSTS
jgi:hypothetical protein